MKLVHKDVETIDKNGLPMLMEVRQPNGATDYVELHYKGGSKKLAWGTKEHVETILDVIVHQSMINMARSRGFTVIEV